MSGKIKNKQVLLVSRPKEKVEESNFKMTEVELDSNLKTDEVLARVIYCSIDPTLRNWMNENPPYSDRIPLGSVMQALGIGQIVETNSKSFSKGDLVKGVFGMQQYIKVNPLTSPNSLSYL